MRRYFSRLLPFLPVLLVYAVGSVLPVMDIDASQYAAIAHEMAETGSYLEVHEQGRDYLDKPPLLFWLSALSYRVFGVSEFAYRLPSLLFSLLAIYATGRLGRLLYGERASWLAALVLASCQAYFLINHDVRTDTLLTGAVALALWQLATFTRGGKWTHLILGFAGVGLAMLAKGPIGAIVPGAALAVDFALRRQWRWFWRPEWLVGLLVVTLLLLPMSVGLYRQFDQHPEKVINGQTGVSGLEFYYWTQSFGRITGDNTAWDNNPDPFFLGHTSLWALLPWSLLFVVAFGRKLWQIGRQRFKLPFTDEGLTVGGFLLPFLALSASSYQLPHYVFVLYPLAAVLTGAYLAEVLAQDGAVRRRWVVIQAVIAGLLAVAAYLLVGISFPLNHVGWGLLAGSFWLGAAYFLFRRNGSVEQRLVLPSLLAICGVNLLLNAHVYPQLFHFQTPGQAAQWVQTQALNLDDLRWYGPVHRPSMNFYARRSVPPLDTAALKANFRSLVVYTDSAGRAELLQRSIGVDSLVFLPNYPVSQLTPVFLNPNTRSQALQPRYLLRIRPR